MFNLFAAIFSGMRESTPPSEWPSGAAVAVVLAAVLVSYLAVWHALDLGGMFRRGIRRLTDCWGRSRGGVSRTVRRDAVRRDVDALHHHFGRLEEQFAAVGDPEFDRQLRHYRSEFAQLRRRVE